MFDKLAEPFPKQEVHWRAQNITRDGDKALALAYIDARDVMRRLDEVAGPSNWQDSYVETPNGRVICSLSIYTDGNWITKSDGAGDTAVEGEKGGLSDAFKRAAVKWGIGRYLYALGNVWVPCETWTGGDGKKRWKRWKANPWTLVHDAGQFSPDSSGEDDTAPSDADPFEVTAEDIERETATMATITSMDELSGYWKTLADTKPDVAKHPKVSAAKDTRKRQLGIQEADPQGDRNAA